MEQIPTITSEDAALELDNGKATFVDIRDPQSFSEARIPGCQHLSQPGLGEFLSSVPHDRPIIVYCYHGISSLGAAEWLLSQGYEDVRSLDGGFEYWRVSQPSRIENSPSTT